MVIAMTNKRLRAILAACVAGATAVLLYGLGQIQAAHAQTPQPRSGALQSPPTVDRPALVRFHSPSLGDAAAKVDIVEFFDPACEACRAVYPLVKQVMQSNPGRVRLTIRYTPFHKGADEIVKLLEATRRQGKYWQTLERLLAEQPNWAINHRARRDLAFKAISGLGLDMQRLELDMRAPELGRLIQQDMDDALALNVSGTPAFFLNGRPLIAQSFDDLRAQIERAVRAAYP